MDYHKESIIANRGTNVPSEVAIGGRTYRKYVSAMLIDELLDKLESFNPADFVDFVPYIVFLQLGMNYSVSVGLSNLSLENSHLDEIRKWLIEQCKIIQSDSETELTYNGSSVVISLNTEEQPSTEETVQTTDIDNDSDNT